MATILRNLLSSSQVVQTMQNLFVHAKSANQQWGVANNNQACPLTCLKCNKVMIDLKEFKESGPRLGSSVMFCETDARTFFNLYRDLKHVADREGTSLKDLYHKAIKPYSEVEKKLLDQLTPAQKSKQWVFIGKIFPSN